ncbi:putative mitochondrial hypothetical protein [Leptomonas pyrrhocoris]|uniref:Uncharacterized protein n=1 Tax=Leptomonas pyrrhocoris TaxID=157538 RepID=A0A0N0DW01_LEPPY|nr:putative mitochondrial hypothetical protein [Leptomonas pyrrhocoris]XP_015659551.1 putative mitochondrial hypothetical protein [Leptomonas pyrrhocoris]XP_015659552.1 putative mitochondrial hypothetical protein [Leptomonas pyrrhocoris]KPA81111.1 putative mitochondrial hypothetical protein [Leptomonas pyrrhocoris]KPA81112.1 putative mitochondrial hypothetical protein [Leptomonas pyrrhocoris]KPA81113.1 putative mitochondrial hypothetical protein [Leptomonas pyrrhocoris]|eukprot:XP_015659550.1 putative mitochondrial hypothetical protein [Leptomonas pyrrhocoris]
MFRRLAFQNPAVSRALRTNARSYFYPCPGETGISGATMQSTLKITLFLIVAQVIFIRLYIFRRLTTMNQFVEDSTDLWENDGTEMEGEEAVANLRIQHERIMPFMNDIKDKLESA